MFAVVLRITKAPRRLRVDIESGSIEVPLSLLGLVGLASFIGSLAAAWLA